MPQILLEDLPLDPNLGQICNTVEPHPGHDLLSLNNVLLQHDPGDRGHECQRLGDLAGLLDSLDLIGRYVPVSQATSHRFEHVGRVFPSFPGCAVDARRQPHGCE